MAHLGGKLKWFLFAALLFVVSCGPTEQSSKETSSAGNTQGPTTQEPAVEGESQQNLKVGGTALFDNGDTVAVYSYASPAQPTKSTFAPRAGTQYAAIDVEGCAGAHTDKPMPLNMFFFALGMPDNTRLQPTVSVVEPALNSANVSPGDCLRGYVSFEVPQDQIPRDVILTSPGTASSVKWAIA